MFSYIRLKNFKSLTDITIDFRSSLKNPKHFVLVYGENSSGKTNLVEAFSFLKILPHTISNQTKLAQIMSRFSQDQDIDNHLLIDVMKKHTHAYDLDVLFDDAMTCGATGELILEFGFNLDQKEGQYRIVYDQGLKEESLYYTLQKNAGYHYRLRRNGNNQISNMCLTDPDYRHDIDDKIRKYWGKHTFLSIVEHDFEVMNKEYMTQAVGISFQQVRSFFNSFSLQIKKAMIQDAAWSTNHESMTALEAGRILKDKVGKLDIKATLIRTIMTSLYADVKDVLYKIEETSDSKWVQYKLFLKKIIGGEQREIDFDLESSGTKSLLRIIPPLFEAVCGHVAVVDEADTGIHDLLFNHVMMKASEVLDGQLIMTTHNTSLLREVDSDAVHFLVSDAEGNKKFLGVSDFPIRTQKNHNVQDRYMQGLYGGIPDIGYLDFEEIRDLMED